ncbi:MAG: type II secretion system secretin GspD [Deltaproteobacteria bacterium]|nr:type II secretion system secretin GspD [Deltaproteobacteria bacterium]
MNRCSGKFHVGLATLVLVVAAWAGEARAQAEPPKVPGGAPAAPAGPKLAPKAPAKAAEDREGKGAAVLPKKPGGLPAPSVPGGGKVPAPAVPGGRPAVPGLPGGAAFPGAPVPGGIEGAEALDEVVSFKSNFEKDVKCVPLPLNAKISVDFEDAPLYDVLKFMACITQRNYLVAANLKQGKNITIMSTTPVTVYEAYKAFLSALDVNGLTVVPAGKFYKLVETGKAKTESLPLYGSRQAVPEEDRLLTRIVVLRHIDVKDIEPVIGKFKTGAGDITAYQPGNSLIVTDLGRNVVRMLKFVDELDVPTGREKIWVRPVQYAAASDMANMVTALFGDKGGKAGAPGGRAPGPGAAPAPAAGGGAAGGGPLGEEGPSTLSKVIADERTNQLILVATPTAYLKIDRLLRRVDVPIEGEGQIHIYYLENAAAEDVAQTLSSLASGSRGGAAKAPAGGAAKGGAGGGGGGSAALFQGEVKVTAHKPTNSLVIESTLKDYMAVKRVVQQLDVRRKQVYVEAVIMEISSNKDRKLGVSGSGGTTFDIGGNTVPFLFGLGGLGMSGVDMQQLNKGGLAVGLQGPLVDVSTGSTGNQATAGALAIPSYGFLIQAIQSTSDVNVLSTPHILTMDNEEAEIVVGKQIPYQASSLGGAANLLGAYGGLLGGQQGQQGQQGQSALSSLAGLGGLGGYGGGFGGYVQRIDVDLTLKLTPQISESNFVKLKISQSIDDVESLDVTLGPTTSKRKVTNTVVVRDQQPVVIGGLIRDIEVKGVDKIPFLGDIPVLGILFRKTAKRVEKRNLLMVITPYIIEDPSDLRRIHDQKMDEMRQFAEYMATRKKEHEGGVDYRKKTGVVEDIRATLERARKDREMLEQTRFEEVDQVGPPATHDLEHDPFGDAAPAAHGEATGEPAPVHEPAPVPGAEPAPGPGTLPSPEAR